MTSQILPIAIWQRRVIEDQTASEQLDRLTLKWRDARPANCSVGEDFPDILQLDDRQTLLAHFLLSADLQTNEAETIVWSVSAEQKEDLATLTSELSSQCERWIPGLRQACTKAMSNTNRSVSTEAPPPSTFGPAETVDDAMKVEYEENITRNEFSKSVKIRATIFLLTKGFAVKGINQEMLLCPDMWKNVT